MQKSLAAIALFLLSISASAEDGVELGFIFKCVENSSLSVLRLLVQAKRQIPTNQSLQKAPRPLALLESTNTQSQ
ncbi:hypothetical protein ACNFD4_13750 [Pseudomonas sp. NY15367]